MTLKWILKFYNQIEVRGAETGSGNVGNRTKIKVVKIKWHRRSESRADMMYGKGISNRKLSILLRKGNRSEEWCVVLV